MHKLMKQLAVAYAPENVKQQIQALEKLQREELQLRNEKDALKRSMQYHANTAHMHDALPTKPSTPLPELPAWMAERVTR